jgi:hypothetical protein
MTRVRRRRFAVRLTSRSAQGDFRLEPPILHVAKFPGAYGCAETRTRGSKAIRVPLLRMIGMMHLSLYERQIAHQT